MQNSVKKGRVNIETLYVIEKGALLFLSINLIAASLGIDKLSWSENSETEFIFGWNSWLQTDSSNTGVVVIRDREYGSSACTLDSCDANKHAGSIFFGMNIMAIILLSFCCIINLEMAVFHYTNTSKKIANAFMACLAFIFNITAWSFWTANSDTIEISQANAGNSTMHACSFWYCVLACLFVFMYCILVLKQNVANLMDKKKLREEARPLPAANIPTARGGRKHQNKDISKLLNSRIITSDKDPPPPTVPELPRKLSHSHEGDEEPGTILTPAPNLALKIVPPPLPPRKSKQQMPPVVRLSAAAPVDKPRTARSRSKGLPSVRTSMAGSGASADEGSSDNVGI